MTQPQINTLITNLKKAGLVTKVLPWMVEGQGDKEFSVRYVGLAIKDDWAEIFSSRDNLMLKFKVSKKEGYLEYYLANKPPFAQITYQPLKKGAKWETLLGEVKRRLKRDKEDALNHRDQAGNWWVKLKPYLK